MKCRIITALACLMLTLSAIAQTRAITVHATNRPISEVLKTIEKKSGYEFFYNDAAFDRNRKVSVNAEETDVLKILETIFSGTGVQASIVKNNIVLTNKPAEQKAPGTKSKKITVSGRVTDATGAPVMGAGVLIAGTTKGTVTDLDGAYSIEVEQNQVLNFNSLGFESVEKKVGDKSVINVTLREDTQLLEEVVVVGYGTQARKTLSTSIAKVDGEALRDAPVSTVGDALKGKVTGLRVQSNNNLPGEAPRFMIRGGSSINRSNDPLCLVDGVERSFEDINPNDIESIEILKDAASAAIYGSRASNGVIFITTRKGNSFKAPQIVFEAQMGVNTPAKKWNLANSREYLTIIRPAILQGPNGQAILNGANGAGIGNTNATDIYSTRYLNEGEEVPAGYYTMPDPVDQSKTILYTDTDWQKEWYNTSFYQKEYIGINGGNQGVKYAASLGYLDDAGMVAMTGYKNLTMHGNTSFKVTDNIEATTTFDFSRNVKHPMTSDYFATLGRGLMMAPTHIGKYADGTFATGGTNKNQQTAEFYEKFYDREQCRQKFMGDLNVKWTPFKWLTATAQYAIYDNSYRGSYYAYGERDGSVNFVSTNRSTSESRTETLRQDVQGYLAFNKTFAGKHKVDGTLGADYSKWTYYSLSASNTGAMDDKIPYLQSGSDNTSGTMSMSNAEYSTALLSYFGRVGYNYADKYVLSATFRADGSSLFLGNNKWGYFPAVSAAWVISEEPFFKKWTDTVNTLKVRASYGQTGNNDIPRTAPLGSYSGSTYAGYNTLVPSVMMNSGLRWETTTQLDLGLDAGFYRDRIRFVFDYFNKLTSDLIYSITLPDTATFGSVLSNVGSVRFWGFEVELHTVNIEKKNFSWSTDLTYSFTRNRVESLPEEYAYTDIYGKKAWRIGGYTASESGYRFGGTAVGEPLGRIWGYKIAGILQDDAQAASALYDANSHGYRRSDGLSIQGRKDAGDYEWVNRSGTAKLADGSEQINAEDMFLLGNVVPHSTGGINNTFRWKRLTFNVYMDFALGHSIYNYMTSRFLQNTLGNSNSNVDIDLIKGCWRYPGDTGAKYARFFPNDADFGNRNYSRISNFNVEKADYLCLRDVSIFYDLPEKWAKAMSMKKLTIGLTGNTIHYFTRVNGAISPETGIGTDGDSGMYTSVQMGNASSNIMPPAMKLLFNVKVTF